MATSGKTGFDRYFDERMKDPSFAEGYARERQAVDQVDLLIRQLEEARLNLGVSKAELARRIGKLPVVVRRLLTKKGANPTLMMAVKLGSVVGLKLGYLPAEPPVQPRPTASKRKQSKRAKREHRATA